MSSDAGIAVVRRNTEEVQSRGNFEVFEELFASDFVDHTPQPGGFTPDRDGARNLYHTLRAAFPDFYAEIHWQISDGDRVTTYKTYHGTHEGEFWGLAPTGRKVHFECVDVMRVRNGKITDHWGVANLLSLAQQLGLVPALGDTKAEAAAKVAYRTVEIDGLDIFYREAGLKDAPVVLLLHGFPTSSHMFRNLIPALADEFHLVAPDYPGFGNSSMPTVDQFEYTFDHLADVIEKFTEKVGLKQYTLYVQDYGAPVGYRLATMHPERVQALVVQNGNAYDEGLDNDFWKPLKAYWQEKTAAREQPLRGFLNRAATIWQYTDGVRDQEAISPDTWNIDQPLLDRPGNVEIQLALFYSYGSNPPLYPKWQAYFRQYQPPTLIVWGKNDQIFPAAGAEPYKRDLQNLEFHLLDTGHFALEEDGDQIADLMRNFLRENVKR